MKVQVANVQQEHEMGDGMTVFMVMPWYNMITGRKKQENPVNNKTDVTQ